MKNILTIMLIILLLFSFGCIIKPNNGGDGTTTSGKSFAFTGKTGITVEFDKDAPPKTNVEGESIELILKLTNRGATSLRSGDVQAKLKGVVATEIFQPTTLESSNEEDLLAAELDPTVAEISLGEITYSPEKMFSAEYDAKIETEICFPYQTKIHSNNFWISDKQSDLSKGKISSSDNSDAPVQVSSLEEFKGTNRVRFNFIVENVGKGTLVESCFPEEKSDETVEITILEPRSANCETLDGGSSGTVKLINGKKMIRCSIPAQKEESFATPLVMEIDYNYNLELSKTISIERIEGIE